MTFNPGDRVRLIESYGNELPAGATAVVTSGDSMVTNVRWEPSRDTQVTSLFTGRFERVDDDTQPAEAAPASVEIDGVEYRAGDVLQLREDQTEVGRALSGFGRVRLSQILHGRQGGDAMGLFEPFDGDEAPNGGWLISRFRHALPRVGDRVRGVWQDDSDRLGTVVSVTPSLTDPVEGSAQVLWDSDGATGGHFFSRLRVVGRATPDGEQTEGNSDTAAEAAHEGDESSEPTTVEEWQKKWTDLVLAAHRIANEHDMCSQFEENTVDLGIPPRSRHAGGFDFDDQGFETPNLVLEEEEEEVEYCVNVSREVEITVPVTVTVTQTGHVHHTQNGYAEFDEHDIDWLNVEWNDVDVDDITSALSYDVSIDEGSIEYGEEPDDDLRRIVDSDIA